MTTRDHVTKWLVYALALLPLCLFDQYFFGRVAPFGVAPLLFPLAAVAVGMMEGSIGGALYGLGVGVVWWLGGGPLAVILLMTLAGLLAGLSSGRGLALSLFSYLLMDLLILAVGDGLRVAVCLLRRTAQLPALLQVAVPEVLCSLVFAVPAYLLYRAVWRRVGGRRLA